MKRLDVKKILSAAMLRSCRRQDCYGKISENMAEADIDLFFKPFAGRFLPCKTKSD
jgi:hypothetical protein